MFYLASVFIKCCYISSSRQCIYRMSKMKLVVKGSLGLFRQFSRLLAFTPCFLFQIFPDPFITGVDGAGGELFGMPLRFSIAILKSAPDSPRRQCLCNSSEKRELNKATTRICSEREERMMDGGC